MAQSPDFRIPGERIDVQATYPDKLLLESAEEHFSWTVEPVDAGVPLVNQSIEGAKTLSTGKDV